MDFELDGTKFDWNDGKAADNLENHGILFDDAAEVFFDGRALILHDARHSTATETRLTAIGSTFGGDILRVTYKVLGSGAYHIISARRAEPHEEAMYDEQ